MRVNALALGVLDTAAARTLPGERAAATLSARGAQSPSGRGIEHFDYLGLVSFLTSPAAEIITGQTVGCMAEQICSAERVPTASGR